MTDPNRLSGWTKFFLVLLRLAIGWHFFFEGWEKLSSYSSPSAPGWERFSLNPTPLPPERKDRWWSAEPYLLESKGPFAPFFQKVAGDSIIDRVAKPAGDEDQPLPPALERDWDAYLDYFTDYYDLDSAQQEQARNKLDQRKAQVRFWLFEKVTGGQTTQDRVADYRKWVEEARNLEPEETGVIGPDEVRKKITDPQGPKAKAARLRRQLFNELFEQYQEMKKALLTVLTQEQGKERVAAESLPPSLWYWHWTWLGESERRASRNNEEEPFRPPFWTWSRLEWMNFLTRYGLTLVGILLVVGLFTRTACVAGALFLLTFYLAMPALPWLLESPRAEGHYFFVNKNIIEMLALLALATTRSGRWLGLDALVQLLNPWRWRGDPAPRPRAPALGAGLPTPPKPALGAGLPTPPKPRPEPPRPREAVPPHRPETPTNYPYPPIELPQSPHKKEPPHGP
jgi:uncharacterized membrane protein YphA (DoxX/SURF4 family)